MYGEGLADLPDKRRLQQGWERDENYPASFRFSFEPNDYKFFMLIPQNEIDANDALTEEDQNPDSNEASWPLPGSSEE